MVGYMPSRRDTRADSGSGQSRPALPWAVVYYKAPDGTVPADEFLFKCPGKVEAEFVAVLDAVASAPPPQFSGGGKWESMHDAMAGWYEVRLTGPGREQFRLFCLLENAVPDELARRGLPRPAIVVITGMRKPWRTTFSERDYAHVRELGRDYKQNVPRRLAT